MKTFTQHILNEVSGYYQDFINESTDELAARHASGANFDRFDSDYINTGCGSQAYGWGWYVSTDPTVHKGYVDRYNRGHNWIEGTTKRGAVEYDVEIPDDNGHNYLEWDGPVNQVDWSKLGITPNSDTFGEVYNSVTNGDNQKAKELSLALSNLGYTGIKISSYRNSGNTSMDMPNYVIFRDNDMNITNRKISDGAHDLEFDGSGVAIVDRTDKCGNLTYNLVDRKGNEVFPNRYDYIGQVGYDTYEVCKRDENNNDVYNLSDSKGKLICSDWYMEIKPLGYGTYRVRNCYGEYNFIDYQGKILWPYWYLRINQLEDGTYKVSKKDKYNNWKHNLADSQGNPIWPDWYDSMKPIGDGTYKVFKKDEYNNLISYLIDRKGNILRSNLDNYRNVIK